MGIRVVLLACLTVCGPRLYASAPPENPSARSFSEESKNDESVVSYLYIEPNEDGAGGGHVALRIGGAVYHYQRLPEGPFVLDRTPFAGFLFSYSRLQNRNIHELFLAVSDAQKERLILVLNSLYIEHRRLVDRLQSHRRQMAFLSELSRAGEARIFVPATGYFFPGENGIGESSFSEKVRAQLADDPVAGPGRGDGSEQIRGTSKRREAVGLSVSPSSEAEALEGLQEAHLSALLSKGLVAAPGAFYETEIPFSGEESARVVSGISSAWERRMGAILAKSEEERPDRARTALELLASLYSLQESEHRGRLFLPLMALLDPSSQSPRDSGQKLDNHSRDPGVQRFRRSLDERLALFQAESRRRLAPDGFCNDECAAEILFLWNRVLEAGSRWALADRYGALTAVDAGQLLTTPSYGRTVKVSVESVDEARAVLEGLKKLEREDGLLKERLNRELGYSLFRKNCATELLKLVEPIVNTGLSVRHPVAGGLFLPWLSMVRMRSQFPGAVAITHLSYRNELLKRKPSSVERSTLTSKFYHFNRRDSLFFFFSEDSGLLSPVFGLVNLVPALGQTIAGVVLLPVDGPSTFSRGVRGMAFSMTEMVGISIRKGTFRSSSSLFYDFPASVDSEKQVQRDERRTEPASLGTP